MLPRNLRSNLQPQSDKSIICIVSLELAIQVWHLVPKCASSLYLIGPPKRCRPRHHPQAQDGEASSIWRVVEKKITASRCTVSPKAKRHQLPR